MRPRDKVTVTHRKRYRETETEKQRQRTTQIGRDAERDRKILRE